MKAIDTNILVYSEITSSINHSRARKIVRTFAEGPDAWAIPWPCLYEFLRVVTHARVFHPPVPTGVAVADLKDILRSPSLILLTETPRHFDVLERLLLKSPTTGNLMHDAHIAALCLEHGVEELVTGDADFSRFQDLKKRDPFRE